MFNPALHLGRSLSARTVPLYRFDPDVSQTQGHRGPTPHCCSGWCPAALGLPP